MIIIMMNILTYICQLHCLKKSSKNVQHIADYVYQLALKLQFLRTLNITVTKFQLIVKLYSFYANHLYTCFSNYTCLYSPVTIEINGFYASH